MMQVELVHTAAQDGLRLDGALLPPAASRNTKDARIDCAICLPGVSGNFYGSTMLPDLARPLTAAGLPVLWANTRGHDLAFTATTAAGLRRQGAAYEIVDECRLDLSAWCQWLGNRGYQRIGLVGHSLGAIKSVYAAAKEPKLPIACVVAISAPRLSYSLFQSNPVESFTEAMQLAQQHVAAGRGQTLIESRFPFPLLISADSFVDKYGPRERYDIVRHIPQLPCSTLFVYGGDELNRGGIAFAEIDQQIAALSEQATAELQVEVIAGANHFYGGHRQELANLVANWLNCT